MTPLDQKFDDARAQLQAGTLTAAILDDLQKAAASPQRLQRLLYLHATNVSIYAPLVNASLFEPVQGKRTQIDPLAPRVPYNNVHEAILDGWRVIHFPSIQARFEDREVDVLGYEFILEKLT